MDSFELNKILGAVLGTCLVVLALNISAGAIFAPGKLAKPGYEIAVPDKPGKPGEAQKDDEPLAALLASADVKRGEASHKKCISCHTFEKNGPNRVGPNLWGIVGKKIASAPGFNYSADLKAMQGEWTIDKIAEFVKNPKGMAPKTNMAFNGIPRARERADLIAYLNQQSDSPQPLPKATEAPADKAPDKAPPEKKADAPKPSPAPAKPQ
jgi:cytochrome c